MRSRPFDGRCPLGENWTIKRAHQSRPSHPYEGLDMERVHRAATEGSADLRAFLARLRDLLVA